MELNFVRCAVIISAAFISCLASPANPQTVTYNFDTGVPALAHEVLPFDQKAGGITAHFSSPQEVAFSVQNAKSMFYKLTNLTGNYLWPNSKNRNHLDIKFNGWISTITLTFATMEYQITAEVPNNVQLTAYQNSTANPVGTASAHGSYTNDRYPQGTLKFDSNARSFNLVQIYVPLNINDTTEFMVDNIKITVTPQTGVLGWSLYD